MGGILSYKDLKTAFRREKLRVSELRKENYFLKRHLKQIKKGIGKLNLKKTRF